MTKTFKTLVDVHMSRARVRSLPATLTLEEWTRTVSDFEGLCSYCMAAPVAVLEHFIPVTRGGGTTAGNCLPSCGPCNGRKHGKMPADAMSRDQYEELRTYLLSRSSGLDCIEIPKRERLRSKQSEVLYLRITPELLANLREDCEAHCRNTGINPSPPEMARKILAEHYKNRSARR